MAVRLPRQPLPLRARRQYFCEEGHLLLSPLK
jgi:hypothetical protein